MEKQVTINEIDYVFQPDELDKRIGIKIAEHRKRHTGKPFWEDLKESIELERSTIQGWYKEGRVPRNPEDLKKLMEYLGGDWSPVLIPVSACPDIYANNKKERFKALVSELKNRGISSSFLINYMNKCFGHHCSLLLWDMMKRGKTTPSDDLIYFLDRTVAIIKHNADFPSKKVCFVKRRQHNSYATRIRHVLIYADFVSNYFRLILNFDVNYFQILGFLYGWLLADKIFEEAFLTLLKMAEETFVNDNFNVEKNETDTCYKTRGRKGFEPTSACALIFTLPGEGVFDRIVQRKRIRQYANNKNIRLDESLSSIRQDSCWMDLCDAVKKIKRGDCDAIILSSSSEVVNTELADKFRLYTYKHGVSVIYLDEAYYQ